MLTSHTVENYLKAIFQAQVALLPSEQLVPMGQLASALGVVPGTATTMVKTLAESGLVRYEPYAGVRLTPAGEKLAALVLRRHRLIELFLVQVMGMSWTEVHDEAEHLEHAVSDRLIERIDEMLGRPAVDPHGDPIPGPEGTLSRPVYDTLMTCPVGEEVTVRRVSDQDSEFLRFVERHDLKPGQVVEVEDRDAAADSVRLRGQGREFTIGARAASKVLVEVVGAVLLMVLLSGAAFAQTPAPAATRKSAEPFAITDNSFLVEEAFNQEAGIFQNIFGAVFVSGNWAFNFTQEWPVVSQAHQFSYTLSALDNGFGTGIGRYAAELPVSGADRRTWAAGVLTAGEPDHPDWRRLPPPRLGIDGSASQPALQQADWRLVLALERRLHLAAECRGALGRSGSTIAASTCSRLPSPAARSIGCGRCST